MNPLRLPPPPKRQTLSLIRRRHPVLERGGNGRKGVQKNAASRKVVVGIGSWSIMREPLFCDRHRLSGFLVHGFDDGLRLAAAGQRSCIHVLQSQGILTNKSL